MYDTIPVCKDIFWVGVNDHETDLFESVWPLPRGVSYNSYLVRGEKSALIDTVKGSKMNLLVDKIAYLLGPDRQLDYLIVNHMEPDHSGAIKILKSLYPDLKIVGNVQTKEMLKNFYALTDDLIIVKEGDVLDLGGHKLRFHLIPMVHWPETMVTFDTETGVLFPCDAFGGFGTLDGGIFDDEVDMEYYEGEILRYYSNIVGRYSPQVQKAIVKLKDLDIRVIAPSHGPIHRKDPGKIVRLYDRWSRHVSECGAVVVYGSMYGNTQRMAEAVARSMAEEGIEKIIVHDISRSHVSFVVRDIWRFKGLVLASCTYNMTLFPPMGTLLEHLRNKMLKDRLVGVCGSYTWAKGVALKSLLDFAHSGGWELLEPQVEMKSAPGEEVLEQCALLGKNMAEKLKTCSAEAE